MQKLFAHQTGRAGILQGFLECRDARSARQLKWLPNGWVYFFQQFSLLCL